MMLRRTHDALRHESVVFGDPVGTWCGWFAWWPIYTSDGRWAWLQVVQRRRVERHQGFQQGAASWWQYRRLSHHR